MARDAARSAGLALVILAALPLAACFQAPQAFAPSSSRFAAAQRSPLPAGLRPAGRAGCRRPLPVSMASSDEWPAAPLRPVVGRRSVAPLVLGGIAAASSLVTSPGDAAEAAQASSKGKVLVVGATGGIGQGACQVLLSQGYEVRGLTRDPEGIKKYEGEFEWVRGVEWVGGDLKKPDTLQNLLKGIDYVIFAPGARAYAEGMENNKLIFADAVTTVAKLAKQAGVKHFVMISSGGIRTWQSYDPKSYIYDVLKWKAKGEDNLREAGLTYTIVRIYLFSRKTPELKDIRITQGDPNGAAAGVTYANLAVVMERALQDPVADNVTFEISDGNTPDGEFWETSFAKLKKD